MKAHKFIFSALLFPFIFMVFSVQAEEKDLVQELEAFEVLGKADFNFLFWSIYEAELYASENVFSHFETLPFALKLTYKRAFTGEQILKETAKQFSILGLEEQNYLAWLSELGNIFPDVKRGDEILLYVDLEANSNFYLNAEYLGSINNKEFSQDFSAIWLARNDRYSEFSRKLIGVKQ